MKTMQFLVSATAMLSLLLSLVSAADIPLPVWKHLSSRNGDLPAANGGTQQTSCVTFDVDGDGHLDILCGEMARWREGTPEPDNPHAKCRIFYGDGKLDIISKPYCWDTSRLDIWLNLGNLPRGDRLQ